MKMIQESRKIKGVSFNFSNATKLFHRGVPGGGMGVSLTFTKRETSRYPVLQFLFFPLFIVTASLNCQLEKIYSHFRDNLQGRSVRYEDLAMWRPQLRTGILDWLKWRK